MHRSGSTGSREHTASPIESRDETKSAVASPDPITSRPPTLIRADMGSRWLDFREIWAYRELLYFLAWRDVKVRYKQTVLGAAWAILQPLLAMVIFSIVFGKFAGIPTGGIPYPLFVYAGLLPWTFFANAVTSSGNSLIGSTDLVTKVYFPRVLIPAAPVLAGSVDFAIAFSILIPLLGYHRVGVSAGILALPLLGVLTAALALAAGIFLAALNVRYRDVRYALPFLIQIWMFASPVIYPASLLPGRWRWVLALNPMAGLIEGYRSSLFHRDLDWLGLGISTLSIFALLLAGTHVFREMEKSFADII